MAARTIDGKSIARNVEDRLRPRVDAYRAETGRAPRLDAVIAGDDAGSLVYLKRKAEAAARLGIEARTHRLPAETSQEDLADRLSALAKDDQVDGILLQLPLPSRLDAGPLLQLIPPAKDVDCFHPTNVGATALGQGVLRPCTPQGILEILDHEKVPLRGADVCIVNHSNIVGRPLALMLLERDATVTVCNKYTRDLARHTRAASILVSGTGVPGLIGREHIRPGAVVIDVGIARGKDGVIAGDVRFSEALEVAAAVTPVPGGVGPLTVAMLMRNIVEAADLRRNGGDA